MYTSGLVQKSSGGYIADNVVIGANAVVTGNIKEAGITVGGIPAKKISNNDSSVHLIRATEIVTDVLKNNDSRE